MSKIVQIYNIERDQRGQPLTVCKEHLKWLKHKFVIIELGTSKDSCSYTDNDGKHQKVES